MLLHRRSVTEDQQRLRRWSLASQAARPSMDSFCIQMPPAAPEAAGHMADAARDDRRLARALVGGGAATAAAALALALRRPPGGVFLRGGAPFYAYYGVLVAAALLGALEVAVGFWVAGEPERRRGWGRLALWVSVVPLVFVAGLGGFAVLR